MAIMLSTLHNFLKYSLCLTFACILYTANVLADPGKKMDLSNQSSSSQHYYTKITLPPASDINNPACTGQLRGTLVVDVDGELHICDGSLWRNFTSPWDQSANEKRIFPKNHSMAQVAIGNNTIPSNPPFNRPDLVKLYLSEPNSSGLNQIEFKPFDQHGNVGIELYTGGIPSGTDRVATYIDFHVGDRSQNWDSRIIYHHAGHLNFIGQRKNGKSQPPNAYPELKFYSNGNVDFGSDENDPPLLPLPSRDPNRKVKVYGDTKADNIILDNDGPGGTAPAALKTIFVNHAGGGSGYYAVYAP